jgi:hypothetical protein
VTGFSDEVLGTVVNYDEEDARLDAVCDIGALEDNLRYAAGETLNTIKSRETTEDSRRRAWRVINAILGAFAAMQACPAAPTSLQARQALLEARFIWHGLIDAMYPGDNAIGAPPLEVFAIGGRTVH